MCVSQLKLVVVSLLVTTLSLPCQCVGLCHCLIALSQPFQRMRCGGGSVMSQTCHVIVIVLSLHHYLSSWHRFVKTRHCLSIVSLPPSIIPLHTHTHTHTHTHLCTHTHACAHTHHTCVHTHFTRACTHTSHVRAHTHTQLNDR